MGEDRNRGRSFLRLYWLCAAAVSLPVLGTSIATGYWEGMAIGLMLGVMGVLGYRRAKANERLAGRAAPRARATSGKRGS